jgi:hypothetical protein
MSSQLPQKYQDVAKAVIPYTPDRSSSQMAVININPALPCFICNQPAKIALITPAPDYAPGGGTPWLTFPICSACERRQVKKQSGQSK